MATDPRYDTVRKRNQHQLEIVPRLHRALEARSALEWEALFGDDVPCSAARTVEDMFDNPQVIAEDMVATFDHPNLGHYRGLKRSFKFDRTPGPEPFAAPMLGQHTDTVIGDLAGS